MTKIQSLLEQAKLDIVNSATLEGALKNPFCTKLITKALEMFLTKTITKAELDNALPEELFISFMHKDYECNLNESNGGVQGTKEDEIFLQAHIKAMVENYSVLRKREHQIMLKNVKVKEMFKLLNVFHLTTFKEYIKTITDLKVSIDDKFLSDLLVTNVENYRERKAKIALDTQKFIQEIKS